MSRSFLPDQELIDRLMTDDTEAFEELYRRYWYSLYNYSYQKLQSSDHARRIVRDIFVRLWEKRKSFPVDFILSEFLYTEVRRSVVVHLSGQLNVQDEAQVQELQSQFSVDSLKQARQPVRSPGPAPVRRVVAQADPPKLFVTLSHVKWLFQSVTAKLL